MITRRSIKSYLEKILKTDVKYLFNGGFYLAMGQIMASGSGLLLTITLAHFLDQSGYGLYSYVFSIAGIFAALMLPGMDSAVAQSVARGFDKTVITGFWTKLQWGIPVGVTCMLAGGYYLFKENTVLGWSLISIGAFSPIIYSTSLYVSYFNGKKLFKKIAFDNAVKNVVTSAAMMTTAFFFKNVLSVVIAFFIISGTISSIRYITLAKKIHLSDSESESESLSFGKHLSVMDMFSIITTHIDKILVFQFLGASSLAIYAIALAPVKQLQGMSKIVRTLILPKYSNRDAADIKAGIKSKFRVFFITSFLITIFYCLVAEFFFKTFFPKYQEAVLYSQILSLCIIFMPFTLHMQALSSLHRKKELYILSLTKLPIKALLLISLIPSFQIYGVVLSLPIFYAIHSLMLLYFFEKNT